VKARRRVMVRAIMVVVVSQKCFGSAVGNLSSIRCFELGMASFLG